MYAIIETGGKQYKVQQGDIIQIERLSLEEGAQVVFDKVLMMGDGADVTCGSPFIDGATVSGKLLENGKAKKVIIFKYKAKKDYRKKQGHRQPYSLVEITAVGGKSAAPKKAEEKTEVKKPSASMKKDELIAFAKEHNIQIDEKATKAVILEAIEANL